MTDFKETAINYIIGEKHCTYYTAERKRITKLMKQAEQYPDEVKIVSTNEDGSVVAHIPLKWFKAPTPSQKRVMSDEQRQAARERFAIARAKKGNIKQSHE